jgi:hypothetical protein
MKGALVGIDESSPNASVIRLQYNPATLSRSLQVQASGDDGSRSEVLRLKGAPIETISLEVIINAADGLETGDSSAERLGIHPQLAALEMLIYPKSGRIITNTALLSVGTIEVIPPAAPFALFVWGPKRVLPVRLSQFTISEDQYDAKLNPIRAKLQLSLRVLSYNDLPVSHAGYSLFMAHQIAKEALATGSGSGTVSTPAALLFNGNI